MKTQPSITVIVPAYNAATTLGACLESLQRQTRPPAEVIVVDDASRDDTVAVARQHGVKVITLAQNAGPGVARNAGAAAATGEILAFTDSDCVPTHDWLERITGALDGPAIVAATGGYAGPVGDAFLTRLQDEVLRVRQGGLPAEIESTITSNFACRRAAFEAVGGFPIYSRRRDPTTPIWGNEDEELGFLLTRGGGKIRWLPDVGVLHGYRASLRGYLRQQKFYAERIVMSHFRYPEMARTRSNYSRSSGTIHLGVTLAFSLSPLLAMLVVEPPHDTLHSIARPLVNATQALEVVARHAHDFAHMVALPYVIFSALAFLLLPVPMLASLRRRNAPGFLVKAYPVLLAVDVAWLLGAVTGILLSIGGFAHGTRKSGHASAPSGQ